MEREEPFSIPALLTGLAVPLLVGGFLNIFAALLGASTNNAGIAFLIGAIPGVLFALWSRSATRNGFAQGLLIGGGIVALIGSTCGAGFVTGFMHF
jgi:uncharacterized membrane protein YdjX (TVP38/TMEM64 family)